MSDLDELLLVAQTLCDRLDHAAKNDRICDEICMELEAWSQEIERQYSNIREMRYQFGG